MSERYTRNRESVKPDLEKRRSAYFQKLAVKYEPEMNFLMKVGGLSSYDENGQRLPAGDRRDWSNVAEHCLTLAAAAEALTEALGLPDKEKERICQAVVIHDWYKRAVKDSEGKWMGKPSGESGDDSGEAQREFNKILAAVGSDLLSVTTPAYLERGFIKKTATLPERLLSYLDAITDGSKIVSFEQRLDNAAASPRWQWLVEDEGWKKKVEPLLGPGTNFFDGQKAQETATQQEIFDLLLERDINLNSPADVPGFVRGEIERQYK